MPFEFKWEVQQMSLSFISYYLFPQVARGDVPEIQIFWIFDEGQTRGK